MATITTTTTSFTTTGSSGRLGGREHFQLKSSVKERPGRPSGVNGGRRGYIIHNSNHDHLLEIGFVRKTWMEEETDRKKMMRLAGWECFSSN